ncbi:5-hydroxytryptamine receptor 1D [Nothobranchius furzeri]|uniref:5-hydroxytryptamine receptor 1D n=1 Tax=Nothobranchius furzeri TaxID=105023 RepID=UPI0024047D7E|nr:5-hydroxytryptamine receptor 1D [Nothobranchius furzeri]
MEDQDGSGSPLRAAAVNMSRVEVEAGEVSGWSQPLLEVLMVLMCLGAVIGNVLVIVTVAATKTLRVVTSVLIMNLALSDLLVGVGVMPFIALSIMNHRWVQCTRLCLCIGYTSSVFCTASVLTLAAIALDRYHSIMDCLRYSSRCTLWKLCAVVLWIWLLALASCSPPLMGWSSISYVVPMYICAIDWAHSSSYTLFMAALTYFVPASVIIFCYVNIVKVALSHARRIHSLEDSVQRSRNSCSFCSHTDSSHQHCRSLHSAWRLIHHINREFVSQFSSEEGNNCLVLPGNPAQQSHGASRQIHAHTDSQPLVQNTQHHHGAMRLLLIVSAFLICWTPYISVVLIQATETAIAGQPSRVPDSVVTFSYWLMLLNSDINPLLYALLSQRFQSALWRFGHKLGAHLGSVLIGAQGADVRSSDPCSLTSTQPTSPPSANTVSIVTVSGGFRCHPEVCAGKARHCGNTPSSSGKNNLQVPSRPQEGSRLPFSALTNQQQATFFFGQITVRVDHNIC